MSLLIRIPAFVLAVTACISGVAQDRCGTVEYTRQLQARNLLLQNSDAIFEDWLKRKLAQRRSARTEAATYRIPVVVHVIHNGEPVGEGTNISNAQIFSQIRALNADFRRENADTVNTPAGFSTVAGKMDIEFVLARRDPEGKATSGIVRVEGSKTQWTQNDNYELKQHSYWPAEDYLNIWVCNMTDFLGLAQFPVSDLPGLENSSNNRLTDGVVIWYRSFGSSEDGDFNLDPDYDRGRTATHEISHFFGLRHVWGDDDDDCSGTDYVDDTPNQGGHTRGCPTQPQTSCSVSTMYQNFLDYTDDACMNLFTAGQVERMITVLENSPRRASLLVSPGLLDPDPVPNDAGIAGVVSPGKTHCSNSASPVVAIKNFGSNTVTSTRVRLRINGQTIETVDASVNLAPQAFANVAFSPINVGTGYNSLTVEILLTNGIADADPIGNDNTLTQALFIPVESPLPFTEDFTTIPEEWTIQNPDQQITWELADAPSGLNDNTGLLLRFFEYEDNFGEQDILYTPVFDLTDATEAVLFFDLAHARFDQSRDELKVIVMKGCKDISEGEIIFDRRGADLATVPSMRSFFVPSSPTDWNSHVLLLDDFVGERYVQVAFAGVNDYGNNLYLDNITVASGAFTDANIKKLMTPSLVTCEEDPSPVVILQNTGTQEIHTLTISLSNGTETITATLDDLSLAPSSEEILTLPPTTLSSGENNLVVTIESVNGASDANLENNTREFPVVYNPATDRIPLRQAFERPFAETWTNVNRTEGMKWEPVPTNFGTSMYFNSFANTKQGDEAWLVSPVLDFSRTTEASVKFDLSYATRGTAIDNFRVLVSTDCGQNYDDLGFEFPEVSSSAESWEPQDDDDWVTNRLDLSYLAGQPNIRLAFVVRNANGNNLYLDNIEFYVTDQADEVEIEDLYSIFGYDQSNPSQTQLKIGFRLSERADQVTCHILDAMGRKVGEGHWNDVLNQVFDLPLDPSLAPGVYIVRLGIHGAFFGTRIVITR